MYQYLPYVGFVGGSAAIYTIAINGFKFTSSVYSGWYRAGNLVVFLLAIAMVFAGGWAIAIANTDRNLLGRYLPSMAVAGGIALVLHLSGIGTGYPLYPANVREA
jgi:hypothetical protein